MLYIDIDDMDFNFSAERIGEDISYTLSVDPFMASDTFVGEFVIPNATIEFDFNGYPIQVLAELHCKSDGCLVLVDVVLIEEETLLAELGDLLDDGDFEYEED